MHRLSLIVSLVLLLPVTVFAQTSWSYHTRSAELAFAHGDLERAESEFRLAIELANSFAEGDPRIEVGFANLARRGLCTTHFCRWRRNGWGHSDFLRHGWAWRGGRGLNRVAFPCRLVGG